MGYWIEGGMVRRGKKDQAAPEDEVRVDALVMRPGRGWKRMKGPVWEHENGVRIHASGLLLRDPNGVIGPVCEVEHRKLLRKLVAINGGNQKRGLMAFALNFYAA